MNIGPELMRRLGPRRNPDPVRPPPRGRAFLAVLLAVAGTAGTLALGWAGVRSESAARIAAGLAVALVSVAVLDRVVAWIRAPIHESSVPDAGDVFDRLATPRAVRAVQGLAGQWSAAPMRASLSVVCVLAVLVALGLARHWGWIANTSSSRGPRGALAPAVPAAPP